MMRVPGIRFVQGRNDYTDSDGRKYGIAIHNTSNDASDEGEASYATRRTDGTSAHFYCDRDSVTQSLDTSVRAGHAGSREGNDHAIAVEITGANAKPRQWWLDNVAWAELGRVLAHVIENDPDFVGFEVRRATVAEMRANPKVQAFYGHDDMRRAWGGTTHTDPGPNFPWDRLIEVVSEALTEGDEMAVSDADIDKIAVRAGEEAAKRVWGTTFASKSTAARWPDGGGKKNALIWLVLSAIHAHDAAKGVTGLDTDLQVDEQVIVAGLLAGLDAKAIAAAIPGEVARQVIDELTRRPAA